MNKYERDAKRAVYGILKHYINDPIVDTDVDIIYLKETPSGFSAIATVSIFDGIYYDIDWNYDIHRVKISVYRKVKDENYYKEFLTEA